MARVQLDACHVSRCVTARREKVTRYIRVSQRTSEVRTFRLSSLRLRVLYALRRSVLLQVLEVDRDEGRRLTRRTRRSKFDEASFNVLVNGQDHL